MTRKVQTEKIQQVQEENKKFQSVIEQLKIKKGINEKEQSDKDMERAKEEDLEKLEREKFALEQQIAEEDKKNRFEMRNWEKKVKDSENKLDVINKELKEKEQENRISKLKIKEMRRLIKHNQLKPIQNNGQLALPSIEQDYE